MRKISRREFVTWSTAGMTGLALAACAPAPATTPTQPGLQTDAALEGIRRGGVLRTNMGTGLPTLNPIISTWLGGFYEMMYDSLFRATLVPDQPGQWELSPGLVDSWEWNDANDEIIFNLREGVKFHDGSDWNAEVCAFNLDMVFNHPQSFSKELFEGDIEEIEVLGDMQVKLNLTGPSATLLLNLSNASGRVYMISKSKYDEVGEEAFGEDPSGTGPFMLDEWIKEDRVTLSRFDEYWGVDEEGEPLPYLDRLEYRLIPEAATQLVELRAGNLDFLFIEAKDADIIEADPNLELVTNPISGAFYICAGLNMQTGIFGENPLVRRAALHAFNREAMLRTFGFGRGEVTPYPYWRPGMLGYNENLPFYDYNPDRARELLAEAGFPDGVDVTLTVIQRPLEEQQAEVIKQMWDSVGIRTELEILERTAWIAKMREGTADAGFWRFTNPVDSDQMSRGLLTGGSNNWGNYGNPQVDELILQGRRTLDEAERQQLYEEMLRLIYEDAALLTCYFRGDLFGHPTSLQGLVFDANRERFHTAWFEA
jgi:peptide/nickel transport system substrate-binding protein